MRLLREIADDFSNIELTVKAHPGCPIDVADYPELKLKLSDQPLSDLIGHFDIAFTLVSLLRRLTYTAPA